MIDVVLQDTAGIPRSAELILALSIGLLTIGIIAAMVWYILTLE